MELLRLRNLKKSFAAPEGGFRLTIDIPHFEMQKGEQIGLTGGSGCGKTTLLHLVAGILRPDGGEIQLEGDDLAPRTEAQRDQIRARRIGYLFQTFNLLQGFTALENVLLAMSFAGMADPTRAKELLGRVGLADRCDYLPRQLSVGQQQRVALARALSNAPALILADEPTGNLDPERASQVIALLKELAGESKAGLLLVSHDPNSLRVFPRVLALHEINRAGAEGANR